MDGDGNFAHIMQAFADFVDQFKQISDEAASSETLIASAEYELDLVKQEFAAARLPALR